MEGPRGHGAGHAVVDSGRNHGELFDDEPRQMVLLHFLACEIIIGERVQHRDEDGTVASGQVENWKGVTRRPAGDQRNGSKSPLQAVVAYIVRFGFANIPLWKTFDILN